MNMDESFNLDDIEQIEIEKSALLPNTDEVSVCFCRGACLQERGRNTCPCTSTGNYCSEACYSNVDCRKFTCMNKRRLIEGESSSDSSDDSADSTFRLDEDCKCTFYNLRYILH